MRHLRRSLDETSEWSRRRFLQASGAGVAIGGLVPSVVRARSRRRSRGRPALKRRGTLDPTLLKLVNRITMGFNRATYDEAVALGYDGFLESQLDYESIDDSEWEARLSFYDLPTLDMTSQEIFDVYEGIPFVPIGELVQGTALRAIYSKRQLFERMVTFWTDHFNIEIRKGQCQWLKTADDRDVIRQYAMTSFPQLLTASAQSAAMSFYLDNWSNVVGHAQENYAREVMELHTMGVNGGYGQGDVEEVARCFTGWAFIGPRRDSGLYGQFRFNGDANHHDDGTKFVLGTEIPPGGGESDGHTVLSILVNHPSTARFIAKKLCAWFLGYDPPEDVVESVKATYQATGGDIKSMLRVILNQNVLTYLSTPKVKRPFHLIASLLRAIDADVNGPRYLLARLETMGQLPFFWPTPDGYPDTLDAWGASVLPRWQFTTEVFYPPDHAVLVNLEALLDSEGGNAPGQQAEAINRILGETLSDEETAIVQEFYDTAPQEIALRDAFGLAASMQGFQWY